MSDSETLRKIQDLLSDIRYYGSKDWRDGGVVERVEWLLSMYEAKKAECYHLYSTLNDNLKPHLVYFVHDEDYGDPSVEESLFTCSAVSEDHAREQCHDAYEDVTVLRVQVEE